MQGKIRTRYKNSNGSIVIRNANHEKFLNSYHLVVQVNNYEIVVKNFHTSHNLTWYSAIVHKFSNLPSLFNLWTDKTINVKKIAQSISTRITCIFPNFSILLINSNSQRLLIPSRLVLCFSAKADGSGIVPETFLKSFKNSHQNSD